MADEQLVHDALVEIGKFAEQPITALFIAILLAGLAPSGRFSVTAARSIFLVAWIVGISSFHTFSAAQFVVASIALSLLVIGLAVWARPEVVPQYFGELIPQRTRFFSSAQLLRQMEFGSSGAILSASGPQGAPLINFFNRDALIVELIRNRVKVSTRIRDRKGEVVAEIIRNAWKVSPPPKTWDRNYNKHALEVVDAHGNVVLQIVVLADRIQVQGEWWGNEKGYELTREYHWQCENCAPDGYRFSILVGTIFENTNIKLPIWFMFIDVFGCAIKTCRAFIRTAPRCDYVYGI